MEFTGERYVPGTIADTMPTAKEHWQRYIFAQKLVKGKTVLDIASGAGYGSDYLSQSAKYVYGVDISQEAIDFSNQKYKRNNLRFMQGSIESIPLESKSVDVVVSFETFEHVDTDLQKKFLCETQRVLKENGILIVSTPNKAIASDLALELWDYKNEFHIKEYYIDEFKDVLSHFFSCVQFIYQRTELVQILAPAGVMALDVLFSEHKGVGDSQNIIAICSNHILEESITGSIVLDTEQNFLKNDRIRSNLSKSATGLNKTNADLQSQIEKLHVQCALATEQNADQQGQIIQLNTQYTALQEQLAELNVSYGGLQQQLITVQGRESDLQQQLITVQGRESDLQQQLITVQGRESDLQQQLITVQGRESDLQQQLITVQGRESNLQQQLITVQGRESDLQQQLIAIQQKAQDREYELKLQLDAQKIAYREQLQANHDISLQLNGVYSSTSWKITKPLRMLGRLLHKIVSLFN